MIRLVECLKHGFRNKTYGKWRTPCILLINGKRTFLKYKCKKKRFPINKSCFIDFSPNALQLIQLTAFPNVIIPSHSSARKTRIKKKERKNGKYSSVSCFSFGSHPLFRLIETWLSYTLLLSIASAYLPQIHVALAYMNMTRQGSISNYNIIWGTIARPGLALPLAPHTPLHHSPNPYYIVSFLLKKKLRRLKDVRRNWLFHHTQHTTTQCFFLSTPEPAGIINILLWVNNFAQTLLQLFNVAWDGVCCCVGWLVGRRYFFCVAAITRINHIIWCFIIHARVHNVKQILWSLAVMSMMAPI